MSVDATAAGTPLKRVWPFFGYDEINYTVAPEGQALLSTLAATQSAPVHVRSHFLFNSGDGTPALKWGSTGVYSEGPGGEPLYDWTLTDGILDAITAAGAAPFLELGFMPEALSRHPEPYRNSSTSTLDGGCFYPPADYAKWGEFIRTWATHAAGRYRAAATDWLWELWNEPDLPYWQGTFDEYTALYDHTEAALHGVLPDAPVGGPAVAWVGSTFLRQFLQHCADGSNAVTKTTGTRLDFVTFHAKGGVKMTDGHIQLNLGNQLRLHRTGFSTVASFPQFARTPIYITEADPEGCAACPASEVDVNAYRNTPAYGAYELAMMKRTLELETEKGINLGGLFTWAFTFPGTPYFAGYRALSTNGINLPVLGAFMLLGRLQGTRLPLASSGARPLNDVLSNGVRGDADIDGLAALDGTTINVLVWNYHDDLIPVAPTPVHLQINVPADFGSEMHMSHLRVDETHGNAYRVWVSQGMPPHPSAEQLTALRQAMNPAALVSDASVAVAADGSVGIDFDLPRFGASLITLRAAEAAHLEARAP